MINKTFKTMFFFLKDDMFDDIETIYVTEYMRYEIFETNSVIVFIILKLLNK